jgi:integrase
MNTDWRIQYYFKDPAQKRKLVIVKGMNSFKTLDERREITKQILANELRVLRSDGFNPITKTFQAALSNNLLHQDINPTTPFIAALRATLKRLEVEKDTRDDMRYTIDGIEKAARQFNMQDMPVGDITRRIMKNLLDLCGKISTKWSNHRYNTYRGYMMMIFKELVELEAAPANPLRDISKKGVVKKIKEVLNETQRKDIDNHLIKAFPEFRQFVHLFFHSGGRKTEIFQLKPSMVNLSNQTYRCVIKKRKTYTEVDRTIKTIAIPFWEFFLKGCPADHYLFGTRFKPAMKPMGKEMPTIYWKKHVKKYLGINIDFYALKHLNTSEIVDALDEKAAAELNAHTTTAMVVNIYDVKQKSRQHNRLKDVGNNFV